MKRFFGFVNTTDVRHIISVIVMVGSFLFLFILEWKGVPAENTRLIDILGGGVLINSTSSVMAWLFSAGKKQGSENEK